MQQQNLTVAVTYVGVSSASYYALKATGLLDMLPGYESMLDSGKDLQIALASGGAVTLSQELLKLVMPAMYGESLLLSGQYLRFFDEAAFDGLVALAIQRSGLMMKAGEAMEQYVSADVAEAITNGLLVGAAQWTQTQLVRIAEEGGGGGLVPYVLYPISTLAARSGMFA